MIVNLDRKWSKYILRSQAISLLDLHVSSALFILGKGLELSVYTYGCYSNQNRTPAKPGSHEAIMSQNNNQFAPSAAMVIKLAATYIPTLLVPGDAKAVGWLVI